MQKKRTLYILIKWPNFSGVRGASVQKFPEDWVSLTAQLVENLPAKQETWVQSLGWEDPLEKGKATHSSKYSGLENSMGCIVHGVAKSWTRMSNFHFTSHWYLRWGLVGFIYLEIINSRQCIGWLTFLQVFSVKSLKWQSHSNSKNEKIILNDCLWG